MTALCSFIDVTLADTKVRAFINFISKDQMMLDRLRDKMMTGIIYRVSQKIDVDGGRAVVELPEVTE